MNCPHCNESLPELSDPFCPHCRGELQLPNNETALGKCPSTGWSSQTRVLLVIVVGVLALLTLPLMALPLIVLGLFGIACIRSAVVHRQQGWIFGIAMGLFMLLVGCGGLVVLLLVWSNNS
jgi:hypothetical protein